ncbi:hypothetical protein [uncultured Clostridium sp.]|uniref:hypothetical protein n=1 Tax=uncultured Clostridium sp. TaxID=59620 RepID=UPI0025F1E025|nr:hypothetical protein [uncultured Clostridium sp.]
MQYTTNYNLKKPEGSDPVNIQDFNDNADSLDTELKKRVAVSGGDISNTKIATADNITTEFPVPSAGDTPKAFLGKMKKFAEDFKNLKTGLLTVGMLVNNCTTNNANLPLSAAQGKVLMDLYTQLNGDLIIGTDKFPPTDVGVQEITVNFPTLMRGTPKVFATWKDTTNAFAYVDGLVITGSSSSGFKIATNRLKPSENWWFCYIAIYK